VVHPFRGITMELKTCNGVPSKKKEICNGSVGGRKWRRRIDLANFVTGCACG
jgi:hypothetical protein